MKLGILIYSIFMLVTSYSFCAAICDIGWKEYSGYCYYVSPTSATWYQADEDCKNMGAQLTSIRNSDEQNFILHITSVSYGSDSYSRYWIGLTSTCTVFGSRWNQRVYCNWRWTDNSSTAYIFNHLSDPFIGACCYIDLYTNIESMDCSNKHEGWLFSDYPVHYICKKEAKVISLPRVTSTEKNTATEISSTTTTVSHITATDMFIRGAAKLNTSKIIPVVVAIAVVVIIIVIVVVVVCMKRRKKASQSQQQQAAEPNIYSVPPVVPSAPPLETLYDSRTESVTVQGSVLNQETTASTSESNINSADENLYTALTSRSGSAQPAGVDNPSYDTLEGTLSMPPSGSDDTVQYAVVKKVKRDPTELELVDNPNYETHSNGLTQ